MPALQGAARFGAFDHRQRHPVLVRAGRIEVFELHEHVCAPGRHKTFEAHDRRTANRVQHGIGDVGEWHLEIPLRRRSAGRGVTPKLDRTSPRSSESIIAQLLCALRRFHGLALFRLAGPKKKHEPDVENRPRAPTYSQTRRNDLAWQIEGSQ